MPYYTLLSFLPILALLILSLWRGVKPAIYISMALTSLIFFAAGSGLMPFLASLISSFVGTVNILMIIFGALLLYEVMSQKGFMEGIKDSLSQIHPKREVRFWFLALFLTAFFENVAGFGTPGAIVPLLLISLGYSPLLSISVVLLIDGLFAITGAVGTPVIAGLETPLGLQPEQVTEIYTWAAIAIAAGGLVVMGFIHRYLGNETEGKLGWQGWVLFLSLMLPYTLLAGQFKELTGIISALIMAGIAYFFIFTQKRLPLRPWTPYWLLVVLLLLPKLIPGMEEWLSLEIAAHDILGTHIDASLKPLRSPLIPFVAASIFALYMAKEFQMKLKPVLNKTLTVFIILFPSLAITQLMLNGGSSNTPSMIEALASVFGKTGNAYPLFSPFIGVIGAFMTGSTTVSNIIFGPVQYSASQALELPSTLILGLQLAGASLGNAVCLFNIIAAAAVAGVKDFQGILQKNLLPVLIASLVIAGVGFIGIWVIG